MIVTCRTTALDAEALGRIGRGFSPEKAARLEVGQCYVVLGIQVELDSLLWGTGAWIQLAVAHDELLVAPLSLFGIVDGRVSAHWEAKTWEDGSLTLWPPSFYADYYRSDLVANKEATLADFRRVCALLEEEARGPR